MIWLLKMLIIGHVHKWIEVEKEPVARSKNPEFCIGYRYTTKCETCGSYRKWECF